MEVLEFAWPLERGAPVVGEGVVYRPNGATGTGKGAQRVGPDGVLVQGDGVRDFSVLEGPTRIRRGVAETFQRA